MTSTLFDPKTPEAAAYMAQRDVTLRERARTWRRVAVALAIALTISVGSNLYGSFTAHTIEARQAKNTALQVKADKRSAANDACQVRYFYAILQDVRLAFRNDKNPNDYARAPKCSAR